MHCESSRVGQRRDMTRLTLGTGAASGRSPCSVVSPMHCLCRRRSSLSLSPSPQVPQILRRVSPLPHRVHPRRRHRRSIPHRRPSRLRPSRSRSPRRPFRRSSIRSRSPTSRGSRAARARTIRRSATSTSPASSGSTTSSCTASTTPRTTPSSVLPKAGARARTRSPSSVSAATFTGTTSRAAS